MAIWLSKLPDISVLFDSIRSVIFLNKLYDLEQDNTELCILSSPQFTQVSRLLDSPMCTTRVLIPAVPAAHPGLMAARLIAGGAAGADVGGGLDHRAAQLWCKWHGEDAVGVAQHTMRRRRPVQVFQDQAVGGELENVMLKRRRRAPPALDLDRDQGAPAGVRRLDQIIWLADQPVAPADQRLCHRLLGAGVTVGDPAWRQPGRLLLTASPEIECRAEKDKEKENKEKIGH